jgi:hypothetical protein
MHDLVGIERVGDGWRRTSAHKSSFDVRRNRALRA